MAEPRTIPFADRREAREAYARIMRGAESYGADAMHATLAEVGRRDLFFLLVFLLGRADADNDYVFARCREVAASPDGHLDLWAREHFKSTIITFALTIQDVLNDPEITVGIFSHTKSIARGFLKQIAREFETNATLKRCYPDVLYADPARQAPQWASDGAGIIVKRSGNPKEATIEASGLVDGQPTGRHYRLMVYDDVVVPESVTSPEMIAKVTDVWAVSLNLGARDGAVRYIGTRYHASDTYKEILARQAAAPRIHPATHDGTMDGDPVLLTRHELAEKRRNMGPYIFACQMLQNPRADAVMGFKQEWLQYAAIEGDTKRIKTAGMNLYLLCDPAGSKKKGSDYTVMAVIGLGADHNWYLVDGLRDRLNLTERCAALMRLHRKYRPVATGYERYGMQADVEHIRQEQEREGYRFPIIELGGSMPKNDRIRRLIPPFEQLRFYLPVQLLFIDQEGNARDFTRELVDEEYGDFPVSAHDDMLDCVSRIMDPDLGAVFPAIRRETSGGVRRRAVQKSSIYA